jgi:hypothetical protein
VNRVAIRVLALAALGGCSPSAPEEEAAPAPVQVARPAPATEPAPTVSVALDRALRWLEARQAADGGWEGDVGTTGLALLAFLGAGETHQSGKFQSVVRHGLTFLRDRQDADGCFGPRTSPAFPRDHALAALAVCEAYGMTSSEANVEPARRGVAFALATRAPGGGWHRPPAAGGALDVETTCWMTMLLEDAVMAGVGADATNRAAVAEAVADLDRVIDPATGRVAGAAGAPSTAGVLLARIFAGHTPRDDALLRTMADAVVAEPPACGTGADVERTYFGTLATYQFGGALWRQWNDPMRELLLSSQRTEPGAADRGFWEVTREGPSASRVRTTAHCCNMLEVYFRIGDRDGWRTEAEKWNR